MNRLVDIRIEDAIENIGRIKVALEQAVSRKSNAGGLRQSLADIYQKGWIGQIQALISECQESLEGSAQIKGETLTAANHALGQLRERLIQISKDSQLENRPINRTGYNTHQSTTLKVLDRKLVRIEQIANDLDEGTGDTLLQKIEKRKPYWAEHIETVAGIVLRDGDFDMGMAIFADEVVQICRTDYVIIVPQGLTILGGDKAGLKELRHPYFRFPTWSIWGLSLAAHGAWHASDKGDTFFKEELESRVPIASKEEIWTNPFIQDCLADTYATYVIGPAYAFARILLSLDVHSAQDQTRAETIFATLEHMAGLDRRESAAAAMLRKEWQEAREAMHQDHTRKSQCLMQRECGVAGGLWQAYWESMSRPSTAEDPAERIFSAPSCPFVRESNPCPLKDGSAIRKMCNTLLHSLPPKFRYPETEWLAVGPGLLEYFDDGQNLPTKGLDIRHILRAAWQTRVKEEKKNDAQRIEELAGRARKLCEEAVKRRGDGDIGRDPNGSSS